MVTKEDLKKEVDKLPENLLKEALRLLKTISSQPKIQKKITTRNFNGRLDQVNIRAAAHE